MHSVLKITDFRQLENSPQTCSRDGLFGDGFFTTGMIVNGSISHLDLHLKRIEKSAKVLKMPTLDIVQVQNDLETAALTIAHATFRLTVSRVQSQRGYAISNQAVLHYQLSLYAVAPSNNKLGSCDLIFANTPISVNPLLAGIKHLNRLDNVLAASEITEQAQESLMFDGEQQVICGSRSNLFIYINGSWNTPLLVKAGVVGITYQRVLKIMEKHQIECHHRVISKNELALVDSAFVCNSLIGIWPAKSLNGRAISSKQSELIKDLDN